MSEVPPRGPLVSNVTLGVLGVLLCGLMIAGSLADFAISEAVLNEKSAYGHFMAAFGWYPTVLAVISAGTLLILAARFPVATSPPLRDAPPSCVDSVTGGNRWVTAQMALGGAFIIGSFTALVVVPPHYWDLPLWVYVLAALGTTGGTIGVTWRVARGAPPINMVRVAGVLLVVAGTQAFIIFLLKLIWLRPRMRLVVSGLGVPFEPWWHVGFPDVGHYLKEGVAKDDFKSFPSAHTGNATVALTLGALVTLHDRLRPYTEWFVWGGIVWGVLVGVGRIIVGAHFLTDTIVGLTVTFIVTVVAYKVAFDGPKKDSLSSIFE